MSRRINTRRRFPTADPIYNSLLVNLMILKILKRGKKTTAQKIIYESFNILKQKTDDEPLKIFEKAVKNVTPTVKIKSKRVGGSTFQVPVELKKFRAINLGLCWIIKFARDRSGKTIAIKLAHEILDASKGSGSAIKKKEDTHRMAEANRAFAHYR
uniref:Small ribosomal subunit protein uS7c n=1 Tax=Ishige okamurae TaxID=233772 RepID=A0A8E5XRR3_9PHAE|nr:ribosomal protein S7 [Ishige okamurae]QVJ99678.1 ribosomal protein S7 [Ishige okamurae]WAM63974.1 30S ribosomal protein S7 [Ishige okamurae]